MAADKELLRTPKFSVIERNFDTGKSSIICHPGAVVILPFVDDDHICLIRNNRKAVGQVLIELPAGTLEPTESPLDTAFRELTEETGFAATQIDPLFEYFVSPGIMNEKMHAFVATNPTSGKQKLMDDEEIEPIVTRFSVALEWVQTGKIIDAKTIATLLFFPQFKS